MPKNSKGKDIAELIPEKCIGCELCVAECPVDAIVMDEGIAKIDPEKCIGCGKCYDICPVSAILFEKPRKKKAAVAKQKSEQPKIKKRVPQFGCKTRHAWVVIFKQACPYRRCNKSISLGSHRVER